MSKPQVLIVDPDIRFREELRHLLEKNIIVEIVGEAADEDEAIKLVKKTQPDIICMNINLTNMNSFETIRNIKILLPDTEILIITEHINKFVLIEALTAGAKRYITKDALHEEIEKAFRKVLRHQIHLVSDLASKMENSLTNLAKL